MQCPCRVPYLGGVDVVLQSVDEQVPHGLPGVPDPLRLFQDHVQLLHGGLGLQQTLQCPLHVPEWGMAKVSPN